MNPTTTTKKFLIGLFVIIALTIAITSLLLLRPKAGDGKERLHVRFAMIDKVNIGTRVTFAGKPVGEVAGIKLIENSRAQKPDSLGRIYIYELALKIDSNVKVYSTDEITLQTLGLFGEKSIAIIPKSLPKGQDMGAPLSSTDLIYAKSSEPLEEAIERIRSVSDKMDQTLQVVQSLVNENAQEIEGVLKGAHQTFKQLQQTLNRVNEVDLMGGLQKTSQSLSQVMQQTEKQLTHLEEFKMVEHLSKISENIHTISDAISQPEKIGQIVENFQNFSTNLTLWSKEIGTVVPKIEKSLDDFSKTAENSKEWSQNLKNISEQIGGGKGSLGRLIKQDDFYLQTTSVLTKVETLMNDLNNYGLLFHNNSTWKKSRAKKMENLSKLKTPEQIVSYFEQELDFISIAITRMNESIKQASTVPGEQPEKDEVFKKAFREVINKLGHVQDMVKLYNEQWYGVNRPNK